MFDQLILNYSSIENIKNYPDLLNRITLKSVSNCCLQKEGTLLILYNFTHE
jgi:hypothetical protein